MLLNTLDVLASVYGSDVEDIDDLLQKIQVNSNLNIDTNLLYKTGGAEPWSFALREKNGTLP